MFTKNFINKILIPNRIAIISQVYGGRRDVCVVTSENPNGTYTVHNLNDDTFFNSEDLSDFKILRKNESSWDSSFYTEEQPRYEIILTGEYNVYHRFHEEHKKYYFDGSYTIPEIGRVKHSRSIFHTIKLVSSQNMDKGMEYLRKWFGGETITPIKKYGYQLFDESNKKHKL